MLLFTRGFCDPSDGMDVDGMDALTVAWRMWRLCGRPGSGDEWENADGTGMGEGEGMNDVSEQIEDEEQLLGLQGEQPGDQKVWRVPSPLRSGRDRVRRSNNHRTSRRVWKWKLTLKVRCTTWIKTRRRTPTRKRVALKK